MQGDKPATKVADLLRPSSDPAEGRGIAALFIILLMVLSGLLFLSHFDINGIAAYVALDAEKIRGGQLGIKEVVVHKSVVGDAEIDILVTNAGKLIEEARLVWDIRDQSGELLDFGSDTYEIASSAKPTWTIRPLTTHIGKISLNITVRFDGGDQAWVRYNYESYLEQLEVAELEEEIMEDVLDIVDGNLEGDNLEDPIDRLRTRESMGSTSQVDDLALVSFSRLVYLTPITEKTFRVEVESKATRILRGLSLSLPPLDEGSYTVIPQSFTLDVGQRRELLVRFEQSDYLPPQEFSYVVSSPELRVEERARIVPLSLSDYAMIREQDISSRMALLSSQGHELTDCNTLLSMATITMYEERYLDSYDILDETEDCLKNYVNAPERLAPTLSIPDGFLKIRLLVWSITLFILIGVLVVVVVGVWHLKKSKGLYHFFTQERLKPEGELDQIKKEYFDETIEKIQEKLK